MESNKKNNSDIEAYVPLCPVCGKELTRKDDSYYVCACGEEIPPGMEIVPHRGMSCKTLGRWGK